MSKNALDKDGKAFGEADAVTAQGMGVEECVRQIVRGVANRADEVLVCSAVERIACLLFSHLPLRAATLVIMPKYRKYLEATLGKVQE